MVTVVPRLDRDQPQVQPKAGIYVSIEICGTANRRDAAAAIFCVHADAWPVWRAPRRFLRFLPASMPRQAVKPKPKWVPAAARDARSPAAFQELAAPVALAQFRFRGRRSTAHKRLPATHKD